MGQTPCQGSRPNSQTTPPHTHQHTNTHTLLCYHHLPPLTSCNYKLCQRTFWLLHSLWICQQITKQMPMPGMTLYLHCISHPVHRVLRAWVVFSVAPVEVELQGGVGRTQAASADLHLVLLQVAFDCTTRRGAVFRGWKTFFCFLRFVFFSSYVSLWVFF